MKSLKKKKKKKNYGDNLATSLEVLHVLIELLS